MKDEDSTEKGMTDVLCTGGKDRMDEDRKVGVNEDATFTLYIRPPQPTYRKDISSHLGPRLDFRVEARRFDVYVNHTEGVVGTSRRRIVVK